MGRATARLLLLVTIYSRITLKKIALKKNVDDLLNNN
jgi:hypothetical protein